MTALREYQRLECTGLWRDTPDGQRREVIVSFGDATLVISEARNARALTHWSLPAVIRLNPGQRPAIYSPGADAGEELEIEEEAMIKAIAKVHALIEARRPHPGRLRTVILGGILAAVVGLGLFWMPRAMVNHTAAALPMSKRQEIGRSAMADLARLTGPACAGPEGRMALRRLHDRLIGPEGEILILPNGLTQSAHLPGGLILIAKPLVEDLDSPDVMAGVVLAENLRMRTEDPMIGILRHAGLGATFRLLTTGDLPAGALAGYGEELLTQAVRPAPDSALLASFAEAGLSVTPYAYALDPSGESVLGLIEADPYRGKPVPAPVLSDSDWVAVQGICGG